MAFLQLILNKIEWTNWQVLLIWTVSPIHMSLNIDLLKQSSIFRLIYLPYLVWSAKGTSISLCAQASYERF